MPADESDVGNSLVEGCPNQVCAESAAEANYDEWQGWQKLVSQASKKRIILRRQWTKFQVMGHLKETITLFLLKPEETSLFLRISYMHDVDKSIDHSIEESSFLEKSLHKTFPFFFKSLSWHMVSSFSSL